MEETVSCELEAAEVLAGLSRSSAPRGAAASGSELRVEVTTSPNPQVQRTVREHTAVVGNPEKTNLLPSNPGGKSRSKLTEDEKEARRIRRILANRESARQAIRRRQAMYLELKGKAAHALEENERLKKEKEQTLKEYTSLKERNEFLKAQIAKIDKAKQDVSETDKFGSATAAGGTSSPTLMPCVWPFSDVVQFQSHGDKKQPCLHNFFLSDDKPCAHKGQQHETSSITTGQGIPVFFVPVPWLLPLLSHNMTTLHSHPCNGQVQSSRQHGTVGDNYTSDISNHQLQGSDFVKTVPGFLRDDISGGATRLFESARGTRNVKGVCDTTSGIDVVSSSGSARHRSLLQKKNQEPVLCPKINNNTNDATEIRRKRKELMKMKYLRFHHVKP